MNETEPVQPTQNEDGLTSLEVHVATLVLLAREICERNETYTFSGFKDGFLEKAEAEENEYGLYATPIREVMSRMNEHGMRVVTGKNPSSGNVFIVPGDCGSSNKEIQNDSIQPNNLDINGIEDQQLKAFIVESEKGKSLR